MRQHQIDYAVARATGESIHTIRERGFRLLRIKSRSERPPSNFANAQSPAESSGSSQFLSIPSEA